MKLFKKKTFLRKVFVTELILIFSLIFSFVISAYVKEIIVGRSGTFPPPRHYRYLFDNYSVLRYFLNLPDSVFLSNKEMKTEITHPLTADILKMETIESLLEEKKYRQVNHLLETLGQPHEFLKEKITTLTLKALYFQQKYPDFIKQYNTAPMKDTDILEIQLLRINCLVRTKENEKAFNLFKKWFLKNRLKPFNDFIPTGTLNGFLQKLGYDDWFKKFKYLVRKNYFSEFLRERRYIKAPELHHLFYAEFYYKRKRYSDAQRHLGYINSPTLLKHKEKLLLKIELRRKNYNIFFSKLNGLKDERDIYTEVLFDSANILLIHRELDLSLALFSKYIKLIEAGDHLNVKEDSNYWKALWSSAWILYRKKDPLRATQYFKKGTLSDDDAYKMANLYWFHRMRKTGTTQLDDYPFSYYYTKTRDSREGSHHDSIKRFITLIDGKQGPLFHQVIDDLKSLLTNHLLDESFDFIHWAKRENRLSDSERNTLKIIESILYLKKKDFYHAFVTFRRNFNCYQCFRLPKFLGSIYTPIRYETLVTTYSKQYKLDRNLVFALIREESFFRPDIVSPARANGLMQLLYGTARSIAARQGIRIKKWDLYNPRINVSLGTDYLKELLDKYSGKLHLALAAFNSGEHRVYNWLQEFGNVPDDVFIELIPFTETRMYVKNILRNYYYYRFYYGG